MKISLVGKTGSLIAFIVAILSSHILGADYWQAIVAGSLFGIRILFLNTD